MLDKNLTFRDTRRLTATSLLNDDDRYYYKVGHKVDMPNSDTFLYAHTSTCTTNGRWLANPNCSYSHFLHNFQRSYECLIHYQSEDSRPSWVVIYVPPNMLTIDPRMLSIFWARGPNSIKHMSFSCPFLDILLRSTYHSNRGYILLLC